MDYVTIAATILGIVLGFGFSWVKYIFSSGNLLKEAGEFMTAVGRAIDDKNVSNEDISAILKEYNDIKAAWDELKALKQK